MRGLLWHMHLVYIGVCGFPVSIYFYNPFFLLCMMLLDKECLLFKCFLPSVT